MVSVGCRKCVNLELNGVCDFFRRDISAGVIFGLSVCTGILGSLRLLAKKKSCIPLFLISLIAVLIQMAYTMLIAGGLRVMGPTGAIMPCVVILLAGVWLCFSHISSRQGWLGA